MLPYPLQLNKPFAVEQREYVRKIVQILKEIYGLEILFDEFVQGKLWGENLYGHSFT